MTDAPDSNDSMVEQELARYKAQHTAAVAAQNSDFNLDDYLKDTGGTNAPDDSWERWLTDKNAGTGQQIARVLPRAAADTTAGFGELYHIAKEGLKSAYEPVAAEEKRRADEAAQKAALQTKWGRPTAGRQTLQDQKPGWLSSLLAPVGRKLGDVAEDVDKYVGPDSALHRVAEAPSASWIESGLRGGAGLAMPLGVGGKLASKGTALARGVKGALAGAGYGFTAPTEGGTLKEHIVDAAGGAAGGGSLGALAAKLEPVIPRIIPVPTKLDIRRGIEDANVHISSNSPVVGKGGGNLGGGILPDIGKISRSVANSVQADPVAAKTIKGIQKLIEDHYKGKPSLGGSEFTALIHQLDSVSENLQTGGKLSATMKTVVKGIDDIVNKLELAVTKTGNSTPEQAAARAARQEYIDRIVAQNAAKPQPPPSDARLWAWLHHGARVAGHGLGWGHPAAGLAALAATAAAPRVSRFNTRFGRRIMPGAGMAAGEGIADEVQDHPRPHITITPDPARYKLRDQNGQD